MPLYVMSRGVVCLFKTTLPKYKNVRLFSLSNMVRKDGLHLETGDAQPPLQKGLLRLYNMRYCPYAQRAVLILDAKNVPYDVVNANLIRKPEWLFQKSVGGKVPALEFDDGKVMGESLIIADYLDEAYSDSPLYPADPRAKALDRLLVEQINIPIRAFFKMVMAESYVKETFDELIKGLSVFEEELKKRGTPFYGGSAPGMLDFMIWPFMERFPVLQLLAGSDFELPKDRVPSLLAWTAQMLNNSVVKQSALPPKVHKKYLENRKDGSYDFEITSLL